MRAPLARISAPAGARSGIRQSRPRRTAGGAAGKGGGSLRDRHGRTPTAAEALGSDRQERHGVSALSTASCSPCSSRARGAMLACWPAAAGFAAARPRSGPRRGRPAFPAPARRRGKPASCKLASGQAGKRASGQADASWIVMDRCGMKSSRGSKRGMSLIARLQKSPFLWRFSRSSPSTRRSRRCRRRGPASSCGRGGSGRRPPA